MPERMTSRGERVGQISAGYILHQRYICQPAEEASFVVRTCKTASEHVGSNPPSAIDFLCDLTMAVNLSVPPE